MVAFFAQTSAASTSLRSMRAFFAQTSAASTSLRSMMAFFAQTLVTSSTLRNLGPFSAQTQQHPSEMLCNNTSFNAQSLRSEPLGRAHAAALNSRLSQWPAVVPFCYFLDFWGNNALIASISNLRILLICLFEELYS